MQRTPKPPGPTPKVTATNKKYYTRPGAEGYRVNKDVTLNDPSNRKMRVITVGAGVSGILMAYRLQTDCANVEHVIYEKNHDIGGTWLESRYPGCACDVPSHAYAYRFALNPDWPHFFSEATDIWEYLDNVCKTFDLRRHMTFRTEVIAATWDEGRGEWKLRLRKESGDGEVVEFDDYCHLLILGTGVLNNFKWPDISGLDEFEGKLIHTARWHQDYQAAQWENDTIAVIGSGSSSLQVVPAMQPHAKALEVFVRTPLWLGFVGGNYGDNRPYDDAQKKTFRDDPKALVDEAKLWTDNLNGLWDVFIAKSKQQDIFRQFFKTRMTNALKDERLSKGFVPSWGLGCRRIPPGDPYMRAIQEENVKIHFTGVARLTKDGVVGQDGIERKVDTVICATGYDASYRPRFPLVGRDGVDLREKWAADPEGYLGLAVPSMPNLLMCIGPAWPIEHGSVMGPLHAVSDYVVQVIHKMQNEAIKSWVPRQDVTDAFNAHVQEWAKHSVWNDDCRTWYKNNNTGRLNAVWPGSTLHYQQVIERPRWEDFEITFTARNMWSFLGMGYTQQDRASSKVSMELGYGQRDQPASKKGTPDMSPYLNIDHLDPKWSEAMAITASELEALVV